MQKRVKVFKRRPPCPRMDRYSAVYSTYNTTTNPAPAAGTVPAQHQERRGPAPFASVEDISSVASFESASSPHTQAEQQHQQSSGKAVLKKTSDIVVIQQI